MTLSNARHSTLVLICKRPRHGHGKQRLAATLGVDTALDIATALLDCVLEDLSAWPGAVVIAPAAASDAAWAKNLLADALIVPQGDGNLGERMQRVDKILRSSGHTHCLFIGSDAPALTLIDYLMAQQTLVDRDIVLTPARDGGVVLMGNRRAWPDLIDLPWSTAQLGAALTQRCNSIGLSVAQLAENFDVDEYADLQFCRAALIDDQRPARQKLVQLLTTLSPEASNVESA